MDALISAKRERHPELRIPLTWTVFQLVCEREHVPVVFGPLPADGVVITGLGSAAIVLNSELHPRRHTYRGAHELAHVWLHQDDEVPVYLMSDDQHDPREDEAEYVALRLMQGW